MRKLKTFAATAVMAGATLSLTLFASAATVKMESPAYYSTQGYYTKTETSAKIETYHNEYNERSRYATFEIDRATSAITGSSSYISNYKTATVILRNGTQTATMNGDGIGQTVKTKSASLGNVSATNATFMGAIYDGNNSTTNDITGYVIYVNKT